MDTQVDQLVDAQVPNPHGQQLIRLRLRETHALDLAHELRDTSCTRNAMSMPASLAGRLKILSGAIWMY
jgi:hypothetical protein